MTRDLLTVDGVQTVGELMYSWARDLFPICRSITGPGVRETLAYLQRQLPDLRVEAVPSGSVAFDWTVPDEWIIRDAYLTDESGVRLIDFRHSNLHVVGYSEPVDRWLTRDELEPHLYSLPSAPSAIPYVTAYYKRTWGFCLPHRDRLRLGKGPFHAVIDSELRPGVLNYGELILPGRETAEVLLSTNICHPSMANNELSGIAVTTGLATALSTRDRRYTYRILFVPETIGAIAYLSRHLDAMRRDTVAGFVVSCVGDDRAYSFVPSRRGGTLADRAALHVLRRMQPDFRHYAFLDRGSDERQYCFPGVDLPVASVMRTKYGEYPEYHTSLDNMDVVSPAGLEGAYHVLLRTLELIEINQCYVAATVAEPQLGRRGLYPTVHTSSTRAAVRTISNVVAYCDGRDLIDLADTIGEDAFVCHALLQTLLASGGVRVVATEAGAAQ
jgi:aminopeptidase-like protein